MPIPTKGLSKDQIRRIRINQVCKECGSMLAEYLNVETGETYMACSHNENHQGTAREYRPPIGFSIDKTRKELEKSMTEQKANQLIKYAGQTNLSEVQAKEIITTMFPKAEGASPMEVWKALKLCTQYGLNPIMKHLFLIPFWNNKDKKHDYVCVQGISSNRLIAARKHNWSFLDDTPRMATAQEAKKHYGDLYDGDNKYYFIAKGRDVTTNSEKEGWAEWSKFTTDKDGNPVKNEPYGTEKGNSITNMGCIRAERNFLDKMYPADMPMLNIPVVDERYVEGQFSVIDEKLVDKSTEGVDETGTAAEKPEKTPTPEELAVQNAKDALAKAEQTLAAAQEKQKAGATVSSTPEGEKPTTAGPLPKSIIDIDWVKETLKQIKWSEITFLSWIPGQPKLKGVDNIGKLEEVLNRLNKEQAEFVDRELHQRQASAQKMFE
jgi:ssDNA-binding Zn-finger/Zn-ribbon topoisomerase 1